MILSEVFAPGDLIEALKDHPELKKAYEMDSGVRGLTLEIHTLMVLSEFEKYFKHVRLPAGVTHAFFRLMLALHDIGKPAAHADGDKTKQHIYTQRILVQVAQDLPLNPRNVSLLMAFLSGDPIGYYLKGKTPVEMATRHIAGMAARSHLKLHDFFDLFTIYYQVDAGSYTQDAGFYKALEILFQYKYKHEKLFDDRRGRLKFSNATEKDFRLLEDHVKAHIK